jgi:hypothetical protein
MSKRELIDAIRQHNRTVSPEFLSRFKENDLQAYLERMTSKRGTIEITHLQTTVEARQQLVVA